MNVVSGKTDQFRRKGAGLLALVLLIFGLAFTLPIHGIVEAQTLTPTPSATPPLLSQMHVLLRARILLMLNAKQKAQANTVEVMLPLVQNNESVPTETPTALPTATPESTATPATVTTQPMPTPDPNVRTAKVPILMYHYLSVPPANADIYRRDLSVTPDLFAAHLDRLQTEGFTTITLADLLLHLTQGAPLPPKPIILTFDDGYRDNYENAFPLLQARGMKATFFIVTDFIDQGRPEYLTWEMARAMHAGGMAIESHGRNHVSLKNKDDDYLIWQALGSMETIEYELGVRPHFVSYPAGEYDAKTMRIFQSANYWAGVTTRQGNTQSSDQLFQWNRVRIRGTTSADEVIRLAQLDW